MQANKINLVLLLIVLFGATLAGQYWWNNSAGKNSFIVIANNSCDVQQQTCLFNSDVYQFELTIPRDIVYLQPFEIHMRMLNESKIPETVLAEFMMQDMQMGLNQFQLHPSDNNKLWSARVVLPVCVTGRVDWQMELWLMQNGTRYRLRVPIEVSSPATQHN